MARRDLDGAVVAVLGASGGLGTPLCRLLSERGALLAVSARDPVRLRELDVPEPLVVPGDITDVGTGQALVEAVRERYGRLDGLVNASGAVAFGTLAETPDEVLEELVLRNVLGPLWLLRRTLPLLVESQGFVVTISGVVAARPAAGMVGYSASKAALAAAASALSRELRRDGVDVLDAQPPHTETGLATRPLVGSAPRMPDGLDPADVAATIVEAIEDGTTVLPPGAFRAG